MKSKTFLMAVLLLLGACASRPPTQVILPAVPLMIASECRLNPVEPVTVDEPILPALPDATAPSYLPVRTQRAELAGLFFQGQRDAEREARIANARTQAVCAAWARAQP